MSWPAPLTLIYASAALLAGLGLGWLHFSSLQRVTGMLLAGDGRAVLLQVGRLAVLGLFLFLCVKAGGLVLIAAAAGILAGRAIVLRGAGWTRR